MTVKEDAVGQTDEQDDSGQTDEKQTLTKEDVQRMIQSETDRVRTEYSRKLKEVESERDELRQKSETAEERLERKLRELEQAKQEMERTQLTISKRDILAELGIPQKFASRVYGNNADEIRKDAEEFARIYAEDLKTGVEKTVNERLAGSSATPKAGEQAKPRRRLETREDGAKASEEELREYFVDIFKE